MQTNQNNQHIRQAGNKPGKSVTKDGYKENGYGSSQIVNQHAMKGSGRKNPPGEDSSSTDQVEDNKLRKESKQYQNISVGITDEEMAKYQITDDELMDGNLHGSTF